MLRLLNRRPFGWLAVGVVASAFTLSAVGTVMLALVQTAFGAALWAGLGLLFWYWVAAGALRRTRDVS